MVLQKTLLLGCTMLGPFFCEIMICSGPRVISERVWGRWQAGLKIAVKGDQDIPVAYTSFLTNAVQHDSCRLTFQNSFPSHLYWPLSPYAPQLLLSVTTPSLVWFRSWVVEHSVTTPTGPLIMEYVYLHACVSECMCMHVYMHINICKHMCMIYNWVFVHMCMYSCG